MLLTVAGAMYGQSWDNSGNSMLNGTYYFRQVYYLPITQRHVPRYLSEAVTIYGSISFDGNGQLQYLDVKRCDDARLQLLLRPEEVCANALPLPLFTATGTYSIASSGYGFITSPYATGDLIYGLVSANGVFVGSSTDNSYGYNDMLVAAPLASPAPTLSSFTGSWTVGDFDFTSGSSGDALTHVFSRIRTASGNLNVGAHHRIRRRQHPDVYADRQRTQIYFQQWRGRRHVSDQWRAHLRPKIFLLLTGRQFHVWRIARHVQYPLRLDRGGEEHDRQPDPSGLYYQAGLDQYASTGDLDSYFGSVNVIDGAAPQTYLEHQRMNDFGGTSVYDYTYDATISLSGVFSQLLARYVVGAGGAEAITSGISPYLGLKVALQAPTTTGTGRVPEPLRRRERRQ